MGNVILHAFNWTFDEVKNKATEIRSLGYDGVLISPPALSEGDAWYDRYQPIDYRVIDSPLGNLQRLKEMIVALKSNGLKVFVDIVFNHMAHRPDDDLDFPGASLLARYKNEPHFQENRLFGNLDEMLFTAPDFNPKGCIDSSAYDDPNKLDEVRDARICDIRAKEGLPDLTETSARVIAMQRAYLQALKELGVEGFRIDAAKHMHIEHIQQVFTPDITKGLFVFGEIIPAHHGQYLDEFITNSNFSAYDFNLFYALHEALKPTGSFETLVMPEGLDPFRSLAFAITHDIPNNEAMRVFIMDENDPARTDENIAYAYVLGRDGGVPLIYSDHGEQAGMYTELWKDAYRKPIIQKMIAFHNEMFGKKMEVLSAGPSHLIISREGAGLILINKSSEIVTVEIPANGIQGSFINGLNDELFSVNTDPFTFHIPCRSGSFYVRTASANKE